MGRITISVYRPKTGKEKDLDRLVEEHLPILLKENLVTDRKPIVMRAADGAVVEIFEWKSRQSIDEAHHNPQVQKLWGRFGEVCDFDQPLNVKEFTSMFSEFEAIN